MIRAGLAPKMVRHCLLALPLLAFPPMLHGQQPRPLEWRVEQQPVITPCSEAELAFAAAPEQIALEKSYSMEPVRPGLECDSISARAFNGARVLRISRSSVIDNGQAYTLVLPGAASAPRLIPFSEGGNLFWGNENDRDNRAAMNAMLQTTDAEYSKNPDWLAISLSYLALLGEEPSLTDSHYAPGPSEHFQSYTVPGLLSQLPELKRKHLLPIVNCHQSVCEVRFYYWTEPVEPLKMADFEYLFLDGNMLLASVHVVDYAIRGSRRKNGKQ